VPRKTTPENQKHRSRLTFAGPLTVQNVAKLRSDLIAKFQESDHEGFDLELSPDSAADLSGVQVILAGRRFAADQHKQFALTKPASGPLRDVLEQGGFLADGVSDTRSFWLHNEAKR